MSEASNQPPALSPPLEPEKKVEPATSPPLEPGEPEIRKLDHQFHLDKQRMEIQFGYKLKELGLDKGVFALVLAVVGSVGYCVANRYLDARRAEEASKLEEFRTKEAGRRSLLEQQLAELFKINSAISDVTRVYFAHAGAPKPANEQEVKKEYETALAKAREAINRSPFLFDLDFNQDVDRYFEVHRQMSRLPMEKWGKYQAFARDLSNKFDELCKSVVEGQRGDPTKRMHMPLSPIRPSERERLSPEQYVEDHFKFWADHKDEKQQ